MVKNFNLIYVSLDDEQNRKQYLLSLITVISPVLTVLSFIGELVANHTFRADQVVIYITFLIGVGLAYLLNQRGHTNVAAYVLAFFSWSCSTANAFNGQGLVDPAMFLQIICVMIAGLVIGERGVVIFTTLNLISNVFFFMVADRWSFSETIPPGDALTNTVLLILFAGVTMYVTAYNMRTFRERLVKYERELRSQYEVLNEEIAGRQQAETMLTAVMKASPTPINVMTANTNTFVLVNDAWLALVAKTADEVIGKRIDEIFASSVAQTSINANNTVVQSRDDFALESTWKLPNGGEERYFYTSKFPVIDMEGNTNLVGSISVDITDLRKAQQALDEHEERFRALIEKSSDMIAIVNDSGFVTFASEATERILGYKSDEIVGMLAFDLIHDDDLAATTEAFQRQLAHPGINITVEVRLRHKNGSYIPMEATTQSLFHMPSINGLIVNARNVTERKKIEAERLAIELKQHQLQKEHEIITRRWNFIARMAHEMRTPLSVILSSQGNLERYFERLTPERRQELLSEISIQVELADSLLNDVLIFSKSEAGMLEFNPVEVNLIELCQQLVRQVQNADKKGHRFKLSINGCDETPKLLDTNLLGHILQNLLTNAAKYSPDNSEVRLETICTEDEITLRVIDNGMGIPADDQKRLFEPFYRANNAQSIKGTGLGLSIVRESVHAHRGTISFESQEGQGTSFTVQLPRLTQLASPAMA